MRGGRYGRGSSRRDERVLVMVMVMSGLIWNGMVVVGGGNINGDCTAMGLVGILVCLYLVCLYLVQLKKEKKCDD